MSANTTANFSLRDCNYMYLHDTAVTHIHLLNIHIFIYIYIYIHTHTHTHTHAHAQIHSELLPGRNLT